MKKDFVPFGAALPEANSAKGGSVTALPAGAQTAAPFHPLTRPPTDGSAHSADHGDPIITFERTGDRVARIKIQCPCGNTIELACDYSDKSLPSAAATGANGEKHDP